MKRISILILVLAAALIFSATPVHAAEGLISGISISGDNISKKLNFSPLADEYTIYVLSPGVIKVDIQAANDDTLLNANGKQSMGQLSISQEISSERTIISVTAREEKTQTIALTFILKETTADTPDTEPAKPSESNPPDDYDQPTSTTEPGEDNMTIFPGEDATQTPADDTQDNPTPDEPLAPTALTFQIDNYTMEVNGLPHQLDAAPMLISPGHTLVPVRFIAEALGGEVNWLPEQQKVEIWLDGQYFSLIIGENVPGTNIAAMIHNSRTFVPLRFVMESLGAQVEWFGEEKVIFIIYPAQ